MKKTAETVKAVPQKMCTSDKISLILMGFMIVGTLALAYGGVWADRAHAEQLAQEARQIVVTVMPPTALTEVGSEADMTEQNVDFVYGGTGETVAEGGNVRIFGQFMVDEVLANEVQIMLTWDDGLELVDGYYVSDFGNMGYLHAEIGDRPEISWGYSKDSTKRVITIEGFARAFVPVDAQLETDESGQFWTCHMTLKAESQGEVIYEEQRLLRIYATE